MRILVTGGAGFLGSAIVRHLEGHEVVVPRSNRHDLRTADGIAGALLVEPDIVIHAAAAVGGIGANAEHPGRFLYENAVMGLQLMDAARLVGVKKFVTIGTACEYPAAAPLPLREESIWDGYPAPETAPYGLAKRLLLAQGQAYRDEYGFNVIHLIPTNLYGPGDNFTKLSSHVIPALVRRFSDAVRQELPSVRLWGSGRATREFLFVEDAAAAVVLAMERYDGAEPVNIGTGRETSIREVADMIATLYGFSGEMIWDPDRPEGVARRWMDTSRAAGFGFTPTVTLPEGLAQTIEWFES